MFQFQIGSIRRCGYNYLQNAYEEFQFQIGSIRRMKCISVLCADLIRFNSKLVRLEVVMKGWTVAHYTRFNSKLVRLEAISVTLPDDKRREFQFQIGSIRSGKAGIPPR